MGRQLKYMGTADIRTVPKGSNFGGQLSAENAVQKDIVFDKDNYWVVDAEEAGLSDEQVELLLEDKDSFKDVSDLKRIPANGHQTTYLGLKSVTEAETSLVSEASSTTSDAATTAGGSTAGGGTSGGSTGGTKGSSKSA